MSFNLFRPLAVSIWLQASVWKMGNLVTYTDSNSNSHTLKFCNIFQVTMHIHTCVRQFLQFGEIDRILILIIHRANLRLGNFFTCPLLQLVMGRLMSWLTWSLCVGTHVLPSQDCLSGNRPPFILGTPVFPTPNICLQLLCCYQTSSSWPYLTDIGLGIWPKLGQSFLTVFQIRNGK